MAEPFDFEKEEFIELDSKNEFMQKTKKKWRENWRKYLKYETLKHLYQLLNDQESSIEAGNKTIVPKSVGQLEEEARAKVLKSQRKWYKR